LWEEPSVCVGGVQSVWGVAVWVQVAVCAVQKCVCAVVCKMCVQQCAVVVCAKGKVCERKVAVWKVCGRWWQCAKCGSVCACGVQVGGSVCSKMVCNGNGKSSGVREWQACVQWCVAGVCMGCVWCMCGGVCQMARRAERERGSESAGAVR